MGKLDKYIPGKGDPWDAAKAAHLARRAGFAATPQEIERLVLLGVDRAVQRFVDYPQEDQDFEKRIEERGGELAELSGSPGVGTFQQVDVLRRWWFYRMAYSPQPLQEKLTLFWHDHFACQQGKIVRAPLILGQNRLFRRFSNGSFRDLLLGVAKDPAMLVFLDNRENVKANPNENWARELLELFTLGVGQYTQKDVSELARVFTGWSTPQKNVPVFVFNSREHDTADKILFGKKLAGMSGESGMDEGRTALDRILARKDCARFLAAKLIAWFVQHEPDQKATEELATVLFKNGYSIQEALRTLLSSAWFYADENRFVLYKNPVDFVVSAVMSLGVQNAELAGLENRARQMGMQLFQPPSVAGWTHGESWINTGAMVHRLNFALALSELSHTKRRVTGTPTLNLDLLAVGDEPLTEILSKRLLQRSLHPKAKTALIAYLEDAKQRLPPGGSAKSNKRRLVRAALHLLLGSPEFAFS